MPRRRPLQGFESRPSKQVAVGSRRSSREARAEADARPVTALYVGAVTGPYFDDNSSLKRQTPLQVPLEDGSTRTIQSPVENHVVGASAIQRLIDNLQWVP